MDIEQFRKCLGQRIKAFRTSQNYSQEQFCEIIDLEQPNLSNIETGKTFPNYITLYNIIEKTNANPSFLFGFVDSKNKIQSIPIDYEILDLLLALPQNSKIHIKSIIENIKLMLK